jgi:chromosome segregation ATPase
MFGKWYSPDELKAKKEKANKLKKQLAEFTTNKANTELSEENERLTIRAEFFEKEHFIQKKRVEVLQDMNETFRENIEQLTDVIKAKDGEIEGLKSKIEQLLTV